MGFVKRSLSLIPRPIVNLVPRETRDRWRTALLNRERRRAARRDQRREARESRNRNVPRRLVQSIAEDIARVDSRLDEIVTRIDQLDARISIAVSGEAPSPVDDVRDLVELIETLRGGIEELQAAVLPNPAPDQLSDAS